MAEIERGKYTDAEAIVAAKAVKLDDFTAPDDNTDLDFSTSKHGLVPKGTNTGNYLKDDGTWAAVSGGYTEGCNVYHDANQTISNSTWTASAFNQEHYDTDTMHDTVTNNSRITIKTAGKYIIIAMGEFADNSTGFRSMYVRLNGSDVIALSRIKPIGAGVGNDAFCLAGEWDFAVNDYIEVMVLQSSGGNLTWQANATYQPQFIARRVST